MIMGGSGLFSFLRLKDFLQYSVNYSLSFSLHCIGIEINAVQNEQAGNGVGLQYILDRRRKR